MSVYHEDLTWWLLRYSEPVIRYRTLVDIMDERDVGRIGRALNDLYKSPLILKWLERLKFNMAFNRIHSNTTDAFENVIGKLSMLGMRAGLQPFDNKTLPYRAWLTDNRQMSTAEPRGDFMKTIIASLLSYAGYGSTMPVSEHLKARLEMLHSFARQPDFDAIFRDEEQSKDTPNSFLPCVHDIRGFAFCNAIMNSRVLRKRAESVVKVIISDVFQFRLCKRSIARRGSRFDVMGWAVHLPGYGSSPEGVEFAELLLTLEMMAPFEPARTSEWFHDSMNYLAQFRTESGTYRFPRAWLPERKVGYWIRGERMGLEENRGNEMAIECESTFWVLRIRKLAGLYS